MEGQTQALTAVMITSVTVGAVATAYIWGAPLLDKRQGAAEVQQLQGDIIELRNSVVSVADGSGVSSQVKLEIPDGSVTVDEKNDFIQVETDAPTSPYPSGQWLLVKGDTLQNLSIGSGMYGLKGQDLPGVVAVKSSSAGDSFNLVYRIEFRNMKTSTPSGERLEKIDLEAAGRKQSTGTTVVQLTNTGEVDDTVNLNKTLPRTRTVVEVDFQ